MRKLVFAYVVLVITGSVFGQSRRNITNSYPQTNGKPTEQEIEKYKKKIEERKEEYIANFLTTLEADDFQKEIIKLSLNDFYEEKLLILKKSYDTDIERKEAIKTFDDTYFLELKDLISESDMKKIKELINGNFDEKEATKKKKKKKKKS